MTLVTNFTNRIEDLAGSTTSIADADALEQWVSDGAQDVAERVKTLKPTSVGRFTKAEAVGDYSSAVNLTEYGEIISVDVGSKEAREIHYRFRHHLGLVDSIHYASSEDPAYYIHNTHLTLKPSTGSGYIHHIPANYTINMSSGTIANFPAEFYRYVMIYAALKVLHRKMVDSSLPPELVLPASPPSITVPDLTIADLTIGLTAPAVPHELLDVSIEGITAVDVASLTIPTYNKPTTVPNFSDIDHWITDEEDSELAGSRISAVGLELQQFSADINNEQAEFQKENARFQAELQTKVAKFNADVSDAGREADLKIQTYQANLQRFSSDVSLYTSEVNKLVNIFTQNMQKDIQIWQGKIQADINKFSADIQDYSSRIQGDTAIYASNLQKKLTEYQWLTTQYTSLKAEYGEAFGIGV